MNAALRETDFANLQGIYSYLDVPPMTPQEEQFLLLYFRGMSITAAARGAGMTFDRGKKLLSRESTVAVLDYLRTQIFQDLSLSVAELNQMLLEAHRKAQTSTEEINAVNSLARLNMLGGFAPAPVIQKRLEQQDEQDRGKDVTPKSVRQLEHMQEDDLMELAAFPGLDNLDPEPASIDEDYPPAPEIIEHENAQTDEGTARDTEERSARSVDDADRGADSTDRDLVTGE